MKHFTFLITTVFLLHACAEQENDNSAHRESIESIQSAIDEDDHWEAELLEYRQNKDEEFKTSRTSPMAGSQYLMSESSENIYLTRNDGTFGLAYFPVADAVLFIVKERETRHWYDQGYNVICLKDDEEMPNGSPLESPAGFLIEEFYVSVNPRAADKVSFIVFDRERPEMKSFEHLHYFPPDKKYAVPAMLVKTFQNDEVVMLTSQNLEKVFYRFAEIRFQLEGKEQQLTAYKYALSGEGSETLFIPFKDATNARETYSAGRYLEIHEPEEERFVLDFNRCFNPLCSYSPAHNCPYPPRENHLQVAIRAGEKTYPQ